MSSTGCGVGRAFVDVVHAQRAALAVGDLDVVGRERDSRAGTAKRSSGVRSASMSRVARRALVSISVTTSSRACSTDRPLWHAQHLPRRRPGGDLELQACMRSRAALFAPVELRRGNTGSSSARDELAGQGEHLGERGRERLLQHRGPAHGGRRLVDAGALVDERVEAARQAGRRAATACTASMSRSNCLCGGCGEQVFEVVEMDVHRAQRHAGPIGDLAGGGAQVAPSLSSEAAPRPRRRGCGPPARSGRR